MNIFVVLVSKKSRDGLLLHSKNHSKTNKNKTKHEKQTKKLKKWKLDKL